MNYLIIEGYKEAAENFAGECGLNPTGDLESIGDRMRIRTAIQSGQIEHAVEMVNDLNPEVCCAATLGCSLMLRTPPIDPRHRLKAVLPPAAPETHRADTAGRSGAGAVVCPGGAGPPRRGERTRIIPSLNI